MRHSLSSALVLSIAAAACGPAPAQGEPTPAPTAAPRVTEELATAVSPAAGQDDFRASFAGYLDCLRWNAATVVSAHRGGPEDGLAENTIEAMAAAVAAGAPLVEIDIRRTRDGVLILMHDDTLDRTTTLEGKLSDFTLEQVQTATMEDMRGAPAAGRPPTLERALAWSENRALVQLDVKDLDDLPAIADLITQAGAQDRVLLIAYTEYGARRIARDAPGLLVSAPADTAAAIADYERDGLPAELLTIFMGVQTHDPELDRALDELSVESIFGTLGGRQSWDQRAERTGDESIYPELAAQGVEVIATDRPRQAMLSLRSDTEMAAAIDRCSPVFEAAVAPR